MRRQLRESIEAQMGKSIVVSDLIVAVRAGKTNLSSLRRRAAEGDWLVDESVCQQVTDHFLKPSVKRKPRK